MDIGSILLLLALIVVVGAYIASPLRMGLGRQTPGEENIELSELLAERERVLEALAELDFDNEMDKIPDEQYPVQREALVKRGAAVLRLLDERLPEAEVVPASVSASAVRPVSDDPIEALIAAKRGGQLVKVKIVKDIAKSNYCANCGARTQPDDRFCPACGQKV